MKNYSVKEIVDAAGGYGYFYENHGLTNFAVRAWFARGIPRRYWKLISKGTGISEIDIEKTMRRLVTQKSRATKARRK